MNSLDGIWLPLSAELGGEKAPAEVLQRTELKLAGGSYAVSFGGEISDRGSYAVDDAGLVFSGLDGPNAGRVIPCLYQQRGDRLRICYGLDGARPQAFATAAGQQLYLVHYRRK